MTEYFIQQRALSSNFRTIVQDNQGNNLYFLIGHWGQYQDTITLYNLKGEILGKIKQTSKASPTRFALFDKEKKIATMQKIPTWKKDWYFISRLNWIAQGNFAKHRYLIKHGKTIIMKMFSEHLQPGDFYSLIVPNDQDAHTAILIAAVLDYWLYNPKAAPSKNIRKEKLDPRFA
jgi:uncharacterized protein YxjI